MLSRVLFEPPRLMPCKQVGWFPGLWIPHVAHAPAWQFSEQASPLPVYDFPERAAWAGKWETFPQGPEHKMWKRTLSFKTICTCQGNNPIKTRLGVGSEYKAELHVYEAVRGADLMQHWASEVYYWLLVRPPVPDLRGALVMQDGPAFKDLRFQSSGKDLQWNITLKWMAAFSSQVFPFLSMWTWTRYCSPWFPGSSPVKLGHRCLARGKVETGTDFISLGSKITLDGDCSHEIKRRLLLGRKALTDLDSILKSRDIILLTKVRLVKAVVFLIVMYGCESWTIKKTECERMMLSNCGAGEDSWESLGLQGDQTSQS